MKALSSKAGKVVHDDPLRHSLRKGLAAQLKASLKNKLLNVQIDLA